MRTVNEEVRQARKVELMKKYFDCYAENGLTGVEKSGCKGVRMQCSYTVSVF